MRLLILKLTATFALWLSGCALPPINLPQPSPITPPAPQQVELKISVGDGKIVVGGGADVTIKNASQPEKTAVERCDCGCGKESCTCSARGNAGQTQSSASTTATAAPQIVSPRRVYECRNGVCGWYDVPIVASPVKPTKSAATASSGRVRVYIQPGNPASEAMRSALRADQRFEFVTGTPPVINGLRWWPTVVTTDGAAWTPGASGWHAQSPQQLSAWLSIHLPAN